MNKKQQSIIMKNIDLLLLQNNEKASSLEKTLGIGSGYISRLKNNAVGISIKLLLQFSDYFKVTIDYLLHDHTNDTSTEKLLKNFFEFIYHADCTEQLYWVLQKSEIPDDDSSNIPFGPVDTIIESVSEYYDELYPEHISKCLEKHLYDSCGSFRVLWRGHLSLDKGRIINGITYSKEELTGDSFCTQVDKEGLTFTLYLYKACYYDEEETHLTEDLIEAYIVDKTGPHFLCNSLESGDFLKNKLNDLYKSASEKCNSNRLDEATITLLRLLTSNTDNQ